MIRRTVVFAPRHGHARHGRLHGPGGSEREGLEQMERVVAKAAEREAFAKLSARDARGDPDRAGGGGEVSLPPVERTIGDVCAEAP
jgi:hypothetical protein